MNDASGQMPSVIHQLLHTASRGCIVAILLYRTRIRKDYRDWRRDARRSVKLSRIIASRFESRWPSLVMYFEDIFCWKMV